LLLASKTKEITFLQRFKFFADEKLKEEQELRRRRSNLRKSTKQLTKIKNMIAQLKEEIGETSNGD
jgi:hypothetical protein